jgi:hypothetical protein
MELLIGIMLLILLIAGLVYFSKSIKRTADYTENCITTTIAESSIDLLNRSTEVNNKLNSMGNFITPNEVYNRITKQQG